MGGAAEEVFERVEADDAAGAGASGASGALGGAGLADADDGELGESGVDAVAGDAGEAGIDDGGDAVDGEGAFGDVGGEDRFALGGGEDGAVLFLRGEVAVEGEGEEAEAPGCAFAGAHGGADFAGSGEEDEDVAIEGRAFEGGGDLFFERLRGVWRVFDGGFEEAAGALDERQAAEGFGVEGGGHDDEAEAGAGGFLEAAEEGEGGVAFEVAFVEFVEDDDVDAVEVGIAEEAACEDAFGDVAEAGAGGGVLVEADLVADEAAEGFAEFLGDTAGGHAGGHAAGFEDEDAAEGKEGRGDAGGFARARSGFEDEDGRGADALDDFGQQGVDGQRLGQAGELTIMPEPPDVMVSAAVMQAGVGSGCWRNGGREAGEERGACYDGQLSGRGSAWLERLVRDQEVGGSNPLAPTIYSTSSHHDTPIRPLQP